MASVANTIRRVDIQATSRGVAEVTAQLDKLGASQQGVTVASNTSEL